MARSYNRRYTEGTKFKPPRLTFSAWEYNPQGLQRYDEKALRREYTRLRDIAQKRLKRMGESVFSESETYQQNVGQFEKTRDIKTASQLRQSLTQLARFVMAESSTIQGQKAIMQCGIQSWREKGYEWVNESNWFEFTRFLEYVSANEDHVYSLDTAMEIYKKQVETYGPTPSAEYLFEAYKQQAEIIPAEQRSGRPRNRKRKK